MWTCGIVLVGRCRRDTFKSVSPSKHHHHLGKVYPYIVMESVVRTGGGSPGRLRRGGGSKTTTSNAFESEHGTTE